MTLACSQTQTFSRVPSILLPAHKQAVRNCPWMVEFWCSYVRSQERVATDHEEIIGVSCTCCPLWAVVNSSVFLFLSSLSHPLATFEKGLSGNFTVAKDYLQLWTVFCDYLRRRVNEEEGGEEMQRRVVDLRRTFKRARDELETCRFTWSMDYGNLFCHVHWKAWPFVQYLLHGML